MTAADTRVEDLLRELAPQVLGALMRRYDDFATAEDAVQEALIAAARQWPQRGLPDYPRGWLIQVASRRMTDQLRNEQARRRREDLVAARPVSDAVVSDTDDTLVLLFMCCHPALKPPAAIALTLRAVGGLSTAEIASAFLLPEATMAQRISRAKQKIKSSGIPFRLPSEAERPQRLRLVLHVLYLIFNEGYTATSGTALNRVELSTEAIRLARAAHRLLPAESEVAGLLALMLLIDARRPARTHADGTLVPLAEQDRSRWDADLIAEGIELITATLPNGPTGPYQVQAAINAVHDEAASARETDWPQILALYGVLERLSDNPMVTLNHAIAAAMVHGPTRGLAMLEPLADKLSGHHRLHAVRAHLLEMSGDHEEAVDQYRAAANRTTSMPERHYLMHRAAQLTAHAECPH
ncbi:RNA polymerase sigma factor [Actinophytocola sp.]|uniref:RNA polymerase sigma factor n=1 Tax=Actinophytocola sp. TaxID=1872138 RepID=UPI003D6ACE6B